MGAKEEWLDGNVAGARAILAEAFKANPNSEVSVQLVSDCNKERQLVIGVRSPNGLFFSLSLIVCVCFRTSG